MMASDPDRVCVTIQHAGSPDLSISRRRLLLTATSWAHAFHVSGVRAEQVVVIILPHGEDLLGVYWGCIMLGAIPSILPTLGDKLAPDKYRADLNALIAVTQPAALVSDFHSAATCELTSDNLSIRLLLTEDISRNVPTTTPPETTFTSGKPDRTAILQHSSGSTGLQKGVALSHTAVLNHVRTVAERMNLGKSDVIVSWLPLYHDMGLIACFILPILSGVNVVLMSPFDWVRAPVRLLQAISSYRGTLCWLPNFALNFMSNPNRVRERDLAGVALSSLRALINCSEPTFAASMDLFAARFTRFGFNSEALCVSYAMAENVFAVSQNGLGIPVRRDVINRQMLIRDQVAIPALSDAPVSDKIVMMSAGQPLANMRMAIIDDTLVPLPDRVVGEVAIHSDCLLTGYFNRPDLNNITFVRLGDLTFFRTGDLGYLAEGEIYITGRKKDLLIVAGKNIYPQDLEQLANTVEGIHPGRTVAFGLFDDRTGTEEVVLLAESSETEPECIERIANEVRSVVGINTDVVVRRVEIVGPGSLIKTSSGKIARSANKERYVAAIARTR